MCVPNNHVIGDFILRMTPSRIPGMLLGIAKQHACISRSFASIPAICGSRVPQTSVDTGA